MGGETGDGFCSRQERGGGGGAGAASAVPPRRQLRLVVTAATAAGAGNGDGALLWQPPCRNGAVMAQLITESFLVTTGCSVTTLLARL